MWLYSCYVDRPNQLDKSTNQALLSSPFPSPSCFGRVSAACEYIVLRLKKGERRSFTQKSLDCDGFDYNCFCTTIIDTAIPASMFYLVI